MAIRKSAPYNELRMAEPQRPESPAKPRRIGSVSRQNAPAGGRSRAISSRARRRLEKRRRRLQPSPGGWSWQGLNGSRGGLGMADAREVMNIRQASQYLGVSPDTLYKYVSEERIPAFKLGNRWKFKKSILDTWMENQSLNCEVSRPRKLNRTSRAVV